MKKRDWAIALGLVLCVAALASCGNGSGSGSGGARASRGNASSGGDGGAESSGTSAKLGAPGQEPSGEDEAGLEEGWLEFVRCLRREGIEMKDPEFSNGEVHLNEARIDSRSPAFTAAREACQGKTLETHGIEIGG